MAILLEVTIIGLLCEHFVRLSQFSVTLQSTNNIIQQLYVYLADDEAVGSPSSSSKNTLVVVRDGAVPKMTLDSNEVQLLSDIPEFKV